ncbi:MAG: C10 family peptidase, partial [Muribaculaceae bacterium]|nr:C10 family peptidase [Muribaculaceae bacterium]
MRHILLTTFLMFCAGTALGRQISYNEAYAIGADFIGKNIPSRTIARNNQPDSNTTCSPYYIFNAGDGGGFVIVAGDTRAKSILAYSPTGSLDNADMPPQLASVLEQYARQISSLSKQAENNIADTRTKAEARSPKVLSTALFHQGTPFNLLTPTVDDVHCPTGCVATAMAIIMKYHNWPDKEMGYQYLDYNWEMTPYDFSAEFDWDNILDDYSGSTTKAQQLAVSKVMAEAGIAAGSDYGQYATGAFTTTLRSVLDRIFRFHPGMKEVQWKNYAGFEPVSANYTDEEWYAMIVNEIDNNRPVLYGAGNYARGGAHNFVIDGYDNNLFHINWGWGGNSNGFFALTALLPTDDYQSAYPDMHEMWIGIMPEEHRPGQTSKLYFDGREGYGISYSVTAIESDVPVTIYLNGLQYRLPDLKGELGVALKNAKGETVEIAAQTRPLSNGVIENVTFHTSGIGADWQLQAIYRENGGGWIEIPGCFGNDHCPT